MTTIQAQLAAATEVEPSKRKNETTDNQDYMQRLAVAVGELSDADWGKLTPEAQDWYNNAADNLKLGKPIAVFPDAVAPATSRRRGGEAAAETKPWAPSVGALVAIVTKRGKNMVGKIAELDDTGLVLDDGTELDHDKIANIGPAEGAAAQQSAEPAEPAEPSVGATVVVVTARGKEITGVIEEMEGDDLVVKDGSGEVHELTKSKLKSIVVKGGGVAPAHDGRRSGEKDAGKAKDTPPAEAEKGKKITAKDNGGVSATQRMRELICSDMTLKKDAVAVLLKKESLEFKQATLDLIYSDSHKPIGILRELKKLK
jgi:hypothetical protein